MTPLCHEADTQRDSKVRLQRLPPTLHTLYHATWIKITQIGRKCILDSVLEL
jgi:hypothetical protein